MHTIIGCGDIGARVARHYLNLSQPVTGWVRSRSSLEWLQQVGVPALQIDLDDETVEPGDLTGHGLFYFAPPPESGRTDTRVKRLIEQLSSENSPKRVVYISTTGVYGDCQGEWVDETRPPDPQADRAWRRLDAEQRWQAWSEETGGELVILRVSGIYGPGKLPERRLRSGVPMVRVEESPITNHIHTLDLVRICVAAMERARPGAIYNVSDGEPGRMTDYFLQVADFLGLPHPPLISLAEAQAQLSPGMLSYLGESRRLSNRKMLSELGIELDYPNLKLGLPACI